MNDFERPGLEERSAKEQLEELYRMIMDTQAEMAQIKADAVDEPSRARELVSLQRTLDALRAEEVKIKENFSK